MTKKKKLKCVPEQKNKFSQGKFCSASRMGGKKKVHLYLVPYLIVSSPLLHMPGRSDCVFRTPDSNSSGVTNCVIWEKSAVSLVLSFCE